MITIAKYSLEEIAPRICYKYNTSFNNVRRLKNSNFKLFNLHVDTFSNKLLSFKRDNFKCVCCGLCADHFLLQRCVDAPQNTAHLNLYGYSNNKILFTKDHKRPISKGGNNRLNNLQTLCSVCNNIKGNEIISNEKLLIKIRFKNLFNIINYKLIHKRYFNYFNV